MSRMKMQTKAAAVIAMCALGVAAWAADAKLADKARIVALLKANPIVTAAVRQAQGFGGTRKCRYEVLRAAEAPFSADQSWNYEAEITCRKDEAAGVVRVLGRQPAQPGGFDEVQVSVFFAG